MVSERIRDKFYCSRGKRIFDLAFAIPVVLFLMPVYTVTALLIRLILGRPVLFKQIRPGLQGKPFTILKFRTMADIRDENGKMLPDDQRLTRLGAFLRKTSMDELPEVINVLRGEMSIVGPRPLFMEYLPYYTSRERMRHTVRPGITGLSQVSGRNYLQWDDRLEMDVQYVENISFPLDVKIIFKTLFQVLRGKDVAVLPGTVSVYLSEYRQQKKEKKT
jgi:lipopolysaccharide/colanic/teichoic acid biosynthesis glycosyltransferase